MDILAHALWTGVGISLGRSHMPIPAHTAAVTLGLAAMPDLLHMFPIIGWWLAGDGSLADLQAYAVAVPGQEPTLPPLIKQWSHHLHCIAHSAVVAGAVSLLVWAVLRSFWIPLLGWWLHIAIDLVTHSTDYYPVQVFYPLSERSFNGLAWNTPWFLAVNYLALGLAALWLLRRKRAKP